MRPRHCRHCGTGAHHPDGTPAIHGHGLRTRQVWGLLEHDEHAEIYDLELRRYLCTDCKRTMTVAPCDLATGLRYSLPSIAMAMALWSYIGLCARAVRERIGVTDEVGFAAAARWQSLVRWARMPWPLATARPAASGPRALAAALVFALLGHLEPGGVPPPDDAAAAFEATASMRRVEAQVGL